MSAEFIEYVNELLMPLGEMDRGVFFGGYAFKSGGKQFAMIMGDTLYFCVNDETRGKYEGIGMEPFSYSTKKGVVKVRKYFSVSAELLEDQDELLEWAKEAIAAAHS